MNVDTGESTIVRPVPPARELRVVNWPVRDDPWYALAVLAAWIVIGCLAAAAAGSVALGLSAFVALLIATWKLWIPVACKLGPTGITVRVLRWRRHIAWRHVACVDVSSRGVLISCAGVATAPAASSTRFYLPWRHRPQLVAEFHAYYGLAPRPRTA